MEKNELLTVGQLAKKMDITVRTLQYYDREGILKPSMLSDGGRRLYSSKDVIRLHQILTLKYLGFSLESIKNKLYDLNTPEEVRVVLECQQNSIEEEINHLQEILISIKSLKEEVIRMNTVDFDRYADIVSLIKLGNENYWVVNAFDDSLNSHVKERFSVNPNLAEEILNTYFSLLDESIELKQNGESPNSDKAQDIAKRWWKMVNDFTGGDMSLLPKLQEFNSDKSKWNRDLAVKQKEVDSFIEEALNCYLKSIDIDM